MMTVGFFAKLRNAARISRLRRNGCIIGRNVQLGSQIRAAAGVVIGDETIIQDGVVLAGQIRIGNHCRIEKMVEINGNVQIGDGSVVGGVTYLSTMPTGRLEIGRDVLINSFSVIGASQHVAIGDHCIFAAYVQITDATHGTDDPEMMTKHAPITSAPVVIGRNVWLGSAAIVMMGTKIGDGAVIGAKSLVNKDIPEMSVAYGIPARVARNRRIMKASA